MRKLLAILALLVLLTGCSPRVYTAENIGKLYDEAHILGKTRDQIRAQYGPFKREYTLDDGREVGAWYVNYENWGLDPSYIHDTYFVRFENGVATEAWFAQTSIGG